MSGAHNQQARLPRADESLVAYFAEAGASSSFFSDGSSSTNGRLELVEESVGGRMPVRFGSMRELVEALIRCTVENVAEKARRSLVSYWNVSRMSGQRRAERKRMHIRAPGAAATFFSNPDQDHRVSVPQALVQKLPTGREAWAKYLVAVAAAGEMNAPMLAVCETSSKAKGTVFAYKHGNLEALLQSDVEVWPLSNFTMEDKALAALQAAAHDGALPDVLEAAVLDPAGALGPTAEELDAWTGEARPSTLLNPEQRRARALVALSRSVAAVQGPPGTGKSFFVANGVLPDEVGAGRRVLVCCQSNAAIDELCAKYAKAGGENFARAGHEMNVRGQAASESFAGSDEIIAGKGVVFTTLYHAQKQEAWRFDTVVVDEAAAVSEAATLAVVGRVRPSKLVLVGDQAQLRPYASRELHALGYGRSFMERLIDARQGAAFQSHVTLLEQHRMPPEIRALVSDLFYQGRLRDAPAVSERDAYFLPATRFLVLDLKFGDLEYAPLELSYLNRLEADAVAAVYRWLENVTTATSASSQSSDNKKDEPNFCILSPFNAHKDTLRTTLFGRAEALENDDADKLRFDAVDTIDKYQGSERRVVLLSPAETQAPFKRIDDPHLLCVALSRATDLLIVVGRISNLAQASPLWRRVLDHARQVGVLHAVDAAADIPNKLQGLRPPVTPQKSKQPHSSDYSSPDVSPPTEQRPTKQPRSYASNTEGRGGQ